MPRYLLFVLIFGAIAYALTNCSDTARTSWKLVAQPDDSDTTLQVVVALGACDDFERFDVRENEPRPPPRGSSPVGETESVTIEAYIHTNVRTCGPAIILHEEMTVELPSPLGDRTLKGCSPPSAKYGPIDPDLADDDCTSSILPLDGETDTTQAATGTPEPTGPVPSTVTRTTEWRLEAEPQGTNLDLIVAVGSSCDSFERLDVTETSESVTIEALILHLIPPPGGDCTDNLHLERHTVQLNAPLDDRELLGCDPLLGGWLLGADVDGDCSEALY